MTDSRFSKSEAKHHLGIDFGTTNSYCCLTSRGFLAASPVIIDGKSSISTAVLWQKLPGGDEKAVAFGDRAVEEWGLSTVSERKNSRISTMFKPDIGQLTNARMDAEAFLSLLTSHLDKQALLPIEARNHKLDTIVGVPAVQATGFKTALMQIFQTLDIGSIRTIAEPVGALINHVATRNDLSPGDARRGILVIDFGGGTCDIAFMRRLEVKSAWGDASLGGRLLDDLFYQWFLELNPKAEKLLKNSHDDYYVHWIRCREMKERFSVTMERDRGDTFSHHIHVAETYYGGLNNVTWDDFQKRASHYKPTAELQAILDERNLNPGDIRTREYDIIQWFRTVLTSGFRELNIRKEDIQYVILTGGSSSWIFVRDIVTQELELDREAIFYSANPMTAVGEGIALLPVLQGLHSEAKQKIKAQRDDKTREIIDSITDIAEEFAEEISSEIVTLIVDDEMRRVLTEFSENGGSIEDLKQRISETVGRRQEECQRIIQRREEEILAAVNREIIEILSEWFRENGMRNWSADRSYMENLGVDTPETRNLGIDDPLYTLVENLTHIIVMSGAGGLLGGGGIALLMPGLQGLVLGAIVGVIFSFVGLKVFKKPLQSTINKLHVPAWLASTLYTDRQMDKMVKKLRNTLKKEILDNAHNVFIEKVTELSPVISERVDAVIEDLSALDHL